MYLNKATNCRGNVYNLDFNKSGFCTFSIGMTDFSVPSDLIPEGIRNGTTLEVEFDPAHAKPCKTELWKDGICLIQEWVRVSAVTKIRILREV